MKPTTSPPRVLVCTTSTLTTCSTLSTRIPPLLLSTPTYPMATLPASLARSQLRGASRRSRSVQPSGAARLPSNPLSTPRSRPLRVTLQILTPMLTLTPRLPRVTPLGSEHILRLDTPPSLLTTRRSTATTMHPSHTIAAALNPVPLPTFILTRKHYPILAWCFWRLTFFPASE